MANSMNGAMDREHRQRNRHSPPQRSRRRHLDSAHLGSAILQFKAKVVNQAESRHYEQNRRHRQQEILRRLHLSSFPHLDHVSSYSRCPTSALFADVGLSEAFTSPSGSSSSAPSSTARRRSPLQSAP